MKPTQEQIGYLQRLDAYALDNYESNGWDYWIEACDPEEKLSIIRHAQAYEEAQKAAETAMGLWAGQRDEIRSTMDPLEVAPKADRADMEPF